jgi:DNA-binding MarR family transcriptional regulator
MGSRLGEELRKSGPFASPEQEATLNLIRTADRIQIAFERLFRRHGLTWSQYNLLRILRGEGKPMPILEMAARTITVVPGITGLVNRLEAAGLCVRARCTEDRRVTYVTLTNSGKTRLADLDEPVLQLHRELLGHFTPEELEQFNRLVEKAREKTGPLVS